jgi:3-deoxy-D-manno-octulosonic-acid transferase
MLLYDIGLFFFRIWLAIAALFDRKIRDGIVGRKHLFETIKAHYLDVAKERRKILIHVSSYGELEQAKPVIEALKREVPDAHIHLTFFSPSGYLNTVSKYKLPDHISYLPFDSKGNVRHFLDITKPDIVLFARYDVWHNFARELKRRNIASVLFSATFSDTPVKRFPFVRKLQQQTYSGLSKIFCISASDYTAFVNYGVPGEKLEVGGDTRYDQVIQRRSVSGNKPAEVSGSLHERLTAEGAFTLVAGSTWPEDEEVLLKGWKSLVQRTQNVHLIIAPHEVTEGHLASLEQNFKPTSRFSFYNGAKVIIVDSVGKLFNLYQYANVAYVGGGFGAGVHNVLEPASWGAPVIVGPKHQRSQEVALLIESGGAFEITDSTSFTETLWKLYQGTGLRKSAGIASKTFVEQRKGACKLIIAFVQNAITLRTPS